MMKADVKIHSLAACCNNRGIGINGKLPWRLPKEMNWFTKLSTGNPPPGKRNAVVMGRKNWDGIPKPFRPFKNRLNIVMSKTLPLDTTGPDAIVRSLDGLISLLMSDEWRNKVHEIINIGGSEIYKLIQDSPYCGKVFLTRVMADFECDVFFPHLDDSFRLLPLDKCPEIPVGEQEEKGIKWKVEVYEKIL